QFETLHPFSNGNGRVGRLIIILQLMEAGALAHPILTLSAWFDERKEAYKNQLLEVSRTGDFNPWVQFFCRAVSETCAADLAHIDELLALQSSLVERAHEAKLRGVAVRIATDLIVFPVIDAPSVARRYQMTYPQVNEALGKLE